jgi:hypothetical protein
MQGLVAGEAPLQAGNRIGAGHADDHRNWAGSPQPAHRRLG